MTSTHADGVADRIKTERPTPTGYVPRDNGLTDAQVAELLAAAGRHKNNPEFIARGQEGVAEYRRQLQEELERELAAEDSK